MSISFETLKNQIKKSPIPKHIAVIMDGNGRWAKKHSLPRNKGHEKGAKNVGQLLESCIELNIKFASLYSFSTENWSRPKAEIDALFEIFDKFVSEKLPEMIQQGIKVIVSGDIDRLSKKRSDLIYDIINKTKNNRRLTANFCLNYGGRYEILRAAKLLIQDRIQKTKQFDSNFLKSMTKNIEPKEFEKHLFTYSFPEVDILVRTAGEKRLSNFLLYQSAYAEFYFTRVLWPDFNKKEFYKSIIAFQKRERKFGSLNCE